MLLLCSEEVAGKLRQQRPFGIGVFVESSHGDLEVTRVRETVRSNGTEVGEFEVALVKLKDITANRALWQINSVTNAARDDANLIGPNEKFALLGLDVEDAVLEDNEEVAVGAVKCLVFRHALARCEDIHAYSVFHRWVAGAGDEVEAVNPVDGFIQVKGVPAELVGDLVDSVAWFVLGICVECCVFPWFEG